MPAMRSLSHVEIQFDRADARFKSGEEIAGTVRVDSYAELDYRRIRLDLLWRTRGDGSTDQGGPSSLELDGEGHVDEGETREFRFSLEAERSRAGRSSQSFRRTIHEEVRSVEAPAEPLAPGVAGEWEAAFHIPDGAPFSLRGHHNTVEWTVGAAVEIAGRADWNTTLAFQVRP